jgi:hypothetical protein
LRETAIEKDLSVMLNGSVAKVARAGKVEFEGYWPTNNGSPRAASIAANGRTIVIASTNGNPLVYRRGDSTPLPLEKLMGPQTFWKSISFAGDENHILATTLDGRTYQWRVFSSIDQLKKVAEESLPWEGKEHIKLRPQTLCRLTALTEEDCLGTMDSFD